MRSHKRYMEIALNLARKGKATSPNPKVGCIIVKRNAIVGTGYHRKAGEDHAEIMAIKESGKKAKDATMYATLEPCSHWGKTPPCTERIVQAGIREVIMAMKDPNPLVDGYKELKFRGLKTRIGVLEKEAKKLNESYIKYIKTKRPFVILKTATTLDGKIATRTGDSKYITGKQARTYVHRLRTEVDAVMAGSNTILKDNPLLTPRLSKGKDPIKIIVDSMLKMPLKAKVLKYPAHVIIATTHKAPKDKLKALQQRGAKIITLPMYQGKIDLQELMKELGKLEITSIMLEGGAELNTAAIKAGIVDKALFFINPAIIGEGLSALGDLGIKKINKKINLKNISSMKLGQDILVEGYL